MSLSKLSKTSAADTFHCKYGNVVLLTHSTYPQWSRDLNYILRAAGARDLTLGAEILPPPNPVARYTDYQKRAGLAVSFIYNSCGPDARVVLEGVEQTPKLMWEALKAEFDSTTSRAGREALVRVFNSLSPKSFDSVGSYITALLEYRNMLAPTDQAISDATFISRLTSTLPDAYDATIQLLHQQPDTPIAQYVSSIKQYESALRLKSMSTVNATSSNTSGTSGAALYAAPSNNSWSGRRGGGRRGRYGRGYNGARPHSNRDHDRHGRQSTSASGTFIPTCWYCGKRGHNRRECRTRERAARVKKEAGTAVAAGADMGHSRALVALSATVPLSAALLSQTSLAELWIIDSGATHHLSCDFNAFHNFEPFAFHSRIPIHMGNDSTIFAVGKGTIRILLRADNSNVSFFLDIVALFAPKLRLSLLSVGQLSAKYSISFTNHLCRIRRDSGEYVTLGDLRDGLWRLTGDGRSVATSTRSQETVLVSSHNPSPPAISPSFPISPIVLWHLRMGHLHYRAVSSVTGYHLRDATPCGVCVKAKHQKSFNREPVARTTRPFELVHSDLCGPISSPSWSGARYLVLYIDDFTRWAYGYFLRSKESTEVSSAFQEFHTRIETAYPKWPITRFRCDNARGEYDNSLFRGILRVSGIMFEPSPPYSQSKNGVSERMIRTIITKSRAMLLDSNLPDEMWAEATETALYLHARSPSASLGGRSPYELLHGKRPILSHLRRFGCLASRLIPKEQRSGKFSARSRECIMIGYVHNTTKIWRLWDPHFRRIVSSSDVIFNESILPAIPGHGPGSDLLKAFLPDSADQHDDDIDPLASIQAELDAGAAKDAMLPGTGRNNSFSPVPPPNAVLSPQHNPDGVAGSVLEPLPVDYQVSRPLSPMDVDKPGPGLPSREDPVLDTLSQDREAPPRRVACLPPQTLESRTTPLPSSKHKRAQETNRMLRRSLRRTRTLAAAAMPASKDASTFGPGDDPENYKMAAPHAEWRQAIKEEYSSLIDNHTWDYVDASTLNGRKAIGCRWVFKTKNNHDGSVRYKARLVIKGYEQSSVGETFAPVARLTSFRVLVALCARFGWPLHHMDVVTAFLNPTIEGDVFMHLPEGLDWLQPDRPTSSNSILRLRKALYGLKQAPRLWYKDIDAFLKTISFVPSVADPNLYVSLKFHSILLLYVDDILIASPNHSHVVEVKRLLHNKYKMTDTGEARQFLGIDIIQTANGIRIHQRRFIDSVLRRFGMHDCNGTWVPLETRPSAIFDPLAPIDQRTYQSLVGSIMYIMLGTRPDLAYAISALSQFSASAGPQHLQQAKRVLRYLQQTKDLCIKYSRDDDTDLHGYSDSDWAGDTSDRKSTGGFLFLLSSAPICWKVKKQTIVALSTTDAEYVAASEACREAVWLRRLVADLSRVSSDATPTSLATVIFTDSTGCLAQIDNARHHERTKHVDIKYHYIRDVCERRLVRFEHCTTHEMAADFLTKPLRRELHWKHLPNLGLVRLE